MAGSVNLEFEDHFPWMIESIGLEGLVEELCKGFVMLMDVEKGLITFESLKRKSASLLGLHDMADDELACMLREGDLDGDGALDQVEFCVLMFRLSPALMELSWMWMQFSRSHHHCNPPASAF